MLNTTLNGEPTPFEPGATVADAVRLLVGQASGGVAVAVGETVIPAGSWSATHLHDGDRIEVLHAVAGG